MKHVKKVMKMGIVENIPEQVLVCEYQPGMGFFKFFLILKFFFFIYFSNFSFSFFFFNFII
jgi:hypothetical protein